MPTIQIFDPALCCSTGVCGVNVDQQLVNFAADFDWARQNGAQIERFNLAQQPFAFARNAIVSGFLQSVGHEALPLILVDGKFALAGVYPSRQQLAVWAGIKQAPSLAAITVVTANSVQSQGSCCGPGSGQAASVASKCC